LTPSPGVYTANPGTGAAAEGFTADHRAVAESRDELYPDAPVQSRECQADGELAAVENRDLDTLLRDV